MYIPCVKIYNTRTKTQPQRVLDHLVIVSPPSITSVTYCAMAILASFSCTTPYTSNLLPNCTRVETCSAYNTQRVIQQFEYIVYVIITCVYM